MENNIVLTPVPLEALLSAFSDMVDEKIRTSLVALQTEKLQDELLTRKDAAKLLGVSLPTLHDWTMSGQVVGYRVGSRVRYKRSELESALSQIRSVKKVA